MGRRSGVTEKEKMYAGWYGHNELRSKKARDVDNASTKGVTDSFSKFYNDPTRHDLAGIDTVVRKEPSGYTKEKGKKAFNDIEEMFGEGGFRFL